MWVILAQKLMNFISYAFKVFCMVCVGVSWEFSCVIYLYISKDLIEN